jgi:hypothetical protein
MARRALWTTSVVEAVTTFFTVSRARLRRATAGDRPWSWVLHAGRARGDHAHVMTPDGCDQAQVKPAWAKGGRLRRSLHQACLRSRRPAAGPAPNHTRRAAWPMRAHPRKVQDLTGRPPRARHPVTAQDHSQRRLRRRHGDGASATLDSDLPRHDHRRLSGGRGTSDS